jgi:hypothetical protein
VAAERRGVGFQRPRTRGEAGDGSIGDEAQLGVVAVGNAAGDARKGDIAAAVDVAARRRK